MSDIQSLVSQTNRQYIKFGGGTFGMLSLDFGELSQKEINALLSGDEGLKLLYDVATASEKYLYEASETALVRKESGARFMISMIFDSNGVVDTSLNGKDSNGGYTFKPGGSYDGHLIISSEGSCQEVDANGSLISKSRSSMVFHELAENYERTTNGIDYHGQNGQPGAHDIAVSRENRWSNRSLIPGGIATYNNPNNYRNRYMILNIIKSQYDSTGFNF
ncbi:MAG: hypothetical protein N4A72_05910 [Bacteroidales bacterium]|jgi:hypothetical protein|nr:hypothetical protein [Bacteroidales bacterium]